MYVETWIMITELGAGRRTSLCYKDDVVKPKRIGDVSGEMQEEQLSFCMWCRVCGNACVAIRAWEM